MFDVTHRTGFTGMAERTDMKFRATSWIPGSNFIPFGADGALNKCYKPLGARLEATPAIDPSGTENTQGNVQAQPPDCDYSQLSHKLVVFFRWRGAEAAEDLAQETLQRGFSKMAAGLELYCHPSHYFFAIARHVLRESRRTRLRDPFYAGIDLEAFSSYASTDHQEDHAARLEECLSTLSSDDRHVVVRYYEGDKEKLSSDLGVDANALRVRVHRVIRRLRETLASSDSSIPFRPGSCMVTQMPIAGSFKTARAAGAHQTARIAEDSNTMSHSTRNNGKQWSNHEKSQLRQLASENTPTRVIGLKLGRTEAAVYGQASKQGTSLGPTNQSPYNRKK